MFELAPATKAGKVAVGKAGRDGAKSTKGSKAPVGGGAEGGAKSAGKGAGKGGRKRGAAGAAVGAAPAKTRRR